MKEKKIPKRPQACGALYLWLLKYQMQGLAKMHLAKQMSIKPQTLYKWEAFAKKDKHFKLPLERAIEIARYFDIHPSLLRNDVVWP